MLSCLLVNSVIGMYSTCKDLGSWKTTHTHRLGVHWGRMSRSLYAAGWHTDGHWGESQQEEDSLLLLQGSSESCPTFFDPWKPGLDVMRWGCKARLAVVSRWWWEGRAPVLFPGCSVCGQVCCEYTRYMEYQWKPEEGAGFLGTGVTDS